MADLELLPRSWPAWNFDVAQGGAFVAEILCPYSWKEKGTLKIGEASYEVYREHFMGGRFLLEERGQIIAFAQKPSALRNSFEVHYAGREYRLDKAALMGRKFIFCEETRQLGFIEPRGILPGRPRFRFQRSCRCQFEPSSSGWFSSCGSAKATQVR